MKIVKRPNVTPFLAPVDPLDIKDITALKSGEAEVLEILRLKH